LCGKVNKLSVDFTGKRSLCQTGANGCSQVGNSGTILQLSR